MITKDVIVHRREVYATFSEDELQDLLIQKLVRDTGFEVDYANTTVKFSIRQKDRPGTSGFEHYVELSLINNIGVEHERA